MSNTLLPCPFCGGEAEIVGGPENWTPTFYDPDSGGDPIAVVCKTCACGLHFFDGCAEAASAWNRRTQPANEPCADCSGMVYRQTASGKIIPADAKCAVIEPPPCYQPDNDGCAYQIYGDNDDEPIDKCKACPLCYSDKVRHNANEPLPDHIGDVTEMVPLTLEQLKQMDGETVFVGESDFWLSGIGTVSVEDGGVFDPDDQDGYWPFDDYGEWLAYRNKPKEEVCL